jgi:hypothetical protein
MAIQDLIPSVEQLVQKVDALIEELRAGRGAGGGAGKTFKMPDADEIKNAGADALQGLGAVAKYGLAAGAVFQSIQGKKDAVLAALDSVAKTGAMKFAAEQVRNASTANEKSANSGASTEMFLQMQNEKATGVSYENQLKNMNSTPTGITSAGSLTGEKFDTLNQTLIKLNADQVAKGRIASGATTPEILAQALQLSQNRSTGNLNKPEDQARAVAAAGKLSDEIDKTAKIMGTSREDIANQSAERLKDGAVQATLSTLQTDQQRQSFIKSQVGLTAFGKDVQDLAKDFTMFGGPTQKTMDTMVALGPAGRELGAAMKDLKGATSEEARAKAEERLERAKGMINERQRDPRAARMAMAADAFPEVKALQGFKRQFEQNQAAAGYNFQRNQGESQQGAQKAINDQVRNLQEGKAAGGGEQSADAKLQGVILSGNRQAAMITAVGMGKLNEELAKSPGFIDEMVKSLKKLGTGTAPAKTVEPKVEVTPSGNSTIGETAPAKPLVPRNTGTLGETGKMFEPKDIVALLHKGERVLNPKENVDLTNLFGMVSSLKSTANVGLNAQSKTETSITGMMKDLQGTKSEEPAPEIEPEVASAEPESAGSESITLKDVHDSLQRLNSTMEVMAGHTADMKDTNRTTADMSQKMTGNRLAV